MKAGSIFWIFCVKLHKTRRFSGDIERKTIFPFDLLLILCTVRALFFLASFSSQRNRIFWEFCPSFCLFFFSCIGEVWLISSSVKSSNPPLPHLLKPVLFFSWFALCTFFKKSLLNFEPPTCPLLVTYPVAHDDAVVLTVCTYSLSPAYLCTRVCTYHIASASWRLAPASLRMESQSGVFFFLCNNHSRVFFK